MNQFLYVLAALHWIVCSGDRLVKDKLSIWCLHVRMDGLAAMRRKGRLPKLQEVGSFTWFAIFSLSSKLCLSSCALLYMPCELHNSFSIHIKQMFHHYHCSLSLSHFCNPGNPSEHPRLRPSDSVILLMDTCRRASWYVLISHDVVFQSFLAVHTLSKNWKCPPSNRVVRKILHTNYITLGLELRKIVMFNQRVMWGPGPALTYTCTLIFANIYIYIFISLYFDIHIFFGVFEYTYAYTFMYHITYTCYWYLYIYCIVSN